jgi:NADH-quinone oxidoreductase subunit C
MADDLKPGGSDPSSPPAPPSKPAAAVPPKPPAVMAAIPWDSDLSRDLKARFGGRMSEASTYLGQNFIVADAGSVISILEYLKLEVDFDYLVDVTAVDWPKREARFDLIYNVYSFSRNERLRIKTYVSDSFKPESAVRVYLAANWLEREVYDMFGIEFTGHPNLRRILLPDEWQGHPLRKDYGILQQDQRWVQENLEIESGQ